MESSGWISAVFLILYILDCFCLVFASGGLIFVRERVIDVKIILMYWYTSALLLIGWNNVYI